MSKFLQYFKLIFYIFSLLFINFECFDAFESIVIVLVGFVFAEKYVARGAVLGSPYPVPMSFPISYSYIAVTINSLNQYTDHPIKNIRLHSYNMSS